jgi:hypothetical protein
MPAATRLEYFQTFHKTWETMIARPPNAEGKARSDAEIVAFVSGLTGHSLSSSVTIPEIEGLKPFLDAFKARPQFVSSIVFEEEEKFREEIPPAFICPVSQGRMTDPVKIGREGKHVFDRSSIAGLTMNPMTREPFSASDIIDLPDLKQEIEEWVEENLIPPAEDQ